jgi:hypothetical protein
VTHGDPEARRNITLAGIDAVWRTSKFLGYKNLQFGGWTATTQGDVGPGSKFGWGLSADYPNDLLDCNASVNQYGDALEPLLGFLPRPGTRRTDAFCAYQPRPSQERSVPLDSPGVLRKRIRPLHRPARRARVLGILHGADQCPV